MMWVIEAGSSSQVSPLYWACEDCPHHWTVVPERAKHFVSHDDAEREAIRIGLAVPRIRSIAP